MNNIGVGIFCFGKDYYFRGTKEKITNFLEVDLKNITIAVTDVNYIITTQVVLPVKNFLFFPHNPFLKYL